MFRIERTNDYGDYNETPYLLSNEEDAKEVIKALEEMYFGKFRVKEHVRVWTPIKWRLRKGNKTITVFATREHNYTKNPLHVVDCMTAIDIGYELVLYEHDIFVGDINK